MSNRNTVVRAIRIDNSLDRTISEIAGNKGLSFNLLVNQILTRYSEYDRVSEKLGFVDLAPSTLKWLLNLISNEESEKLGKLSGLSGRNAKQLVSMLVGDSSLQSFLSALKIMEKYSGAFYTEISTRDEKCQVIMSHNLGVKWSHFLKGMMASTLEDIYNLRPEFEATENFVTTTFHFPKEVVAAAARP